MSTEPIIQMRVTCTQYAGRFVVGVWVRQHPFAATGWRPVEMRRFETDPELPSPDDGERLGDAVVEWASAHLRAWVEERDPA